MKIRNSAILAAITIVAGLTSAANAGEWRLGIADHDTLSGKESGFNIQPQYVFDSKIVWGIQPYLAASTNTDGNISYAGAGLMRSWDFSEDWFGEFQFGVVVHDGRLDLPPPNQPIERQRVADTEVTYGCSTVFQWGPAFGRRFDNGVSVAAYYEHLSHGQILCSTEKNEGLDQFGIRFGKKF